MRGWVALASMLPLMAFGAPARAQTGRYVALGDSFTAGPLIPHLRGSPAACLRSDHNYPSLVARALGFAKFSDVSCSAATIADMAAPQRVLFGQNAPQLDAVTPDASLVTIGIGGNDVGYTSTIYTCAALSLTAPKGAPCHTKLGDSLDRRAMDAGPQVAAVLRTIHARAPRARVLVVGYLRLLPPRVGCWPAVPMAAGDVPYLDRLERRVNAMLATEAARNGATFVDTYRGGVGHDMCSAHKWVEGILSSHLAMPVHPNATGMRLVARRVLAALRERPATTQ